MQLAALFLILTSAFNVLASSNVLRLVTEKSDDFFTLEGNPLDNASVIFQDDKLRLQKNKSEIYSIVDDDYHLAFANGSYVAEQVDGYFKPVSKSLASTPFSIKDGYLYYQHNRQFYAVTEDEGYTLYTRATGGDAIGIFIKVSSIEGHHIPDFPQISSHSPSGGQESTKTP